MVTIAPEALSRDAEILTSSISRPALIRFVNRARTAIGLAGTVSVLLTTDYELQRLNRIFRHKNKATDVLSFPALPIPGIPVELQQAGDLAISLETAARQAAEHGHDLADELRILLLHGLLHLAGLDHETDRGEMAARESDLRAKLRLPNTLIARSTEVFPLKRRPGISPDRKVRDASRPSMPSASSEGKSGSRSLRRSAGKRGSA